MKMMEVKDKAKMMGVKSGKMKKSELIKAIQVAEGYHACFGSGTEQCPQMECSWREDCLTN
ncbi:MAG: SAP domain-containing protein [Proteobacteria bacterium]|nr:SAP domain-containing protein [Pseudomonadota bacterium]MBU1687882.1 SAP domain-containing protein [Pseudomonadota bacterium]